MTLCAGVRAANRIDTGQRRRLAESVDFGAVNDPPPPTTCPVPANRSPGGVIAWRQSSCTRSAQPGPFTGWRVRVAISSLVVGSAWLMAWQSRSSVSCCSRLARDRFWLLAGAFSGFLVVAPVLATGLPLRAQPRTGTWRAGDMALLLRTWTPGASTGALIQQATGVWCASACCWHWLELAGTHVGGVHHLFSPVPIATPEDFCVTSCWHPIISCSRRG